MQGAPARPTVASGQLADAFASFTAAAERLEHSHYQLHQEVASLRKQLEERNRALASSVAENERMRVALRQILDALPCGVVVLDADGQTITLLNPEACRLLGIPADQTNWSNFPEDLRLVLKKSDSWKQGDEHDFCFENAGAKRWVTVRFSIMDEASVKNSGETQSNRVILICRDTTLAKETEQQRDSSRNLVALAEMATVLAHEIRNPLGSMELLTGLLASDNGLTESSKDCVQHLQTGVRSLSAVVNNVLRFHSMGAESLHRTSLAEALRSAVEFVRPLAQQGGVVLTFDNHLGKTEIAADANGIQQVLLNLVSNALRHTSNGGKITVSAAVTRAGTSDVAVVDVADTGTGISSDDLPHIFEPGFSKRHGPGLGLTVCERIVEQHNGTITAQSHLGEGTVFRMEFPVI
jgi:two-component system sensor histidine kinase FlrB